MMIKVIRSFLFIGPQLFRYKEGLKDILSEENQRIMGILEQIRKKLLTKNIVRVYLSTKLVTELSGKCSRIYCNFNIF